MQSALLPNGNVVTAKAYDESLHGVRIACMDRSCRVPVSFIPGSRELVPHFRTSGKGASVHTDSCGFAKKLTFQETVAKVGEYQSSIQEQGIREFIVRLNMNSIDPDFTSNVIERNPGEPKEKQMEELDKEALKDDKPTPQSIGSLRSVKKLFTTVEPDLLASIIVTIKGKRIPISELIRPYDLAHEALWKDETLDVPYFIHGVIDRVIRREKVWYINFKALDDGYFSLIVFDRHFHHFTLKDDELIGKDVLAFGTLRKNTFKESIQSTEMVIKTNQYIEFL